MYDINALAMRVANRTIGKSDPRLILGIPDESLLGLVKASAVDEIMITFNEVTNKNEALLQSFGMTNTQESIAITFNNIAEILLNDDVLNRAVELLKEMGREAGQ